LGLLSSLVLVLVLVVVLVPVLVVVPVPVLGQSPPWLEATTRTRTTTSTIQVQRARDPMIRGHTPPPHPAAHGRAGKAPFSFFLAFFT